MIDEALEKLGVGRVILVFIPGAERSARAWRSIIRGRVRGW